MPNEQAFREILDAEAELIMSMPTDTMADVRKHAAEARRRVTRKRNELTGTISKAWKEGFAALKAENDQMQKDLRAAHKSVDQGIAELMADQLIQQQR
jgi:hypothetical protein